MYGTLRPGHAPAEIAEVVERLALVGRGTIRGTLYDLGEYPGVVLGGADEVGGDVFALPDDADVLARLDAYEVFLPEDVEGSLFVRVTTAVTLADGASLRCWVYAYNQPVAGRRTTVRAGR